MQYNGAKLDKEVQKIPQPSWTCNLRSCN